jgi:hypothetical protein
MSSFFKKAREVNTEVACNVFKEIRKYIDDAAKHNEYHTTYHLSISHEHLLDRIKDELEYDGYKISIREQQLEFQRDGFTINHRVIPIEISWI